MFSGGSYGEVERWLLNFVNSHAKLESPQVEAAVEADEKHPVAYGVSLRLGDRQSPRLDLEFRTVAENRGSLQWCHTLAARVRAGARDLLLGAPVVGAPEVRPVEARPVHSPTG